jgi:hypothetical protein
VHQVLAFFLEEGRKKRMKGNAQDGDAVAASCAGEHHGI